jgi:hypothetical protein
MSIYSILANTSMMLDGSTESKAAPNASYIKSLTGTSTSGNYWIKPPGQSAYEIYCDMSNQSGGWMLVAVGREGRADDAGNRDWWRDTGDTGSVYALGLKQGNLSGSGNYNPRYMPNAWIQAACGGNTWNEVEMIINRAELGDSYYFRTSSSNFAWSNFEVSAAPHNLTYNRYTGQWLGGTSSYSYTNTQWTDTLNNGAPVGNDASRLFTWTWTGHVGGSIQYTGWSSGSSISSPGYIAAAEGHALQFVNVFVK